MASRTFEEDLAYGLKEGERRVVWALVCAKAQVQHFGALASFDLTATIHFGHPERIEVKCEDHYKDGQNICIELFQGRPSRPSGISTSESTVCIHTLGPRIVLYRTQHMRLFLKENDSRWELIAFNRSTNHNKGVIYPISDAAGHWWFDVSDDTHLADSRVFIGGTNELS